MEPLSPSAAPPPEWLALRRSADDAAALIPPLADGPGILWAAAGIVGIVERRVESGTLPGPVERYLPPLVGRLHKLARRNGVRIQDIAEERAELDEDDWTRLARVFIYATPDEYAAVGIEAHRWLVRDAVEALTDTAGSAPPAG